MGNEELRRLEVLAARIRRDVLVMLEHRGYGHLGGSLSIVELMSVLYGRQLRYDPKNPRWPGRDRVVLSKGHAGPAWYAALAESGFFDPKELLTLNDGGTMLPSHPDRTKTPGVDMTTGSLGQGASTAAGMAIALRMEGSNSYVYLVMGDGELNEGQCWEAFQFVANYRISHCVVIIDENKRQLDGPTKEVMDPFDIVEKMRAFGFSTQRVRGNDVGAIDLAIDRAKGTTDSAVCIVLDSVKGSGVPYFERMRDNHSVKWNSEATVKATDEAISKLTRDIDAMERRLV